MSNTISCEALGMPPKIRHTNTFGTSCKSNEQINISTCGKDMSNIDVKGWPLPPTLFSFYIDEPEHIWLNMTDLKRSLVNQAASLSQYPCQTKG